jgi:D-glycero-D-manno-heptose 1,7-bisphosphate phosphatase
VFLDRDGVLNEAIVRDGKPYSPLSPDEVVVVAGMPEACARLRAAGFALVVVTNQPDIARGRQSVAGVEAVNAVVRGAVDVDGVYVCPHDDADGCHCRKPKPGLLVDAAHDLGVDLGASFMVGDRHSDVEAGRRAGCRTVYIDLGYREPKPGAPDHVATAPVAAIEWILGKRRPEEGGRVRGASLRNQDLR